MPNRILLIDDEPLVRNVAGTCLSRAGYDVVAPEVERESESVTATRAALSGEFELLLMDLRLPHVDTVPFLDEFRIRHPALPIVVIAGFVTPEIRETLEALKVGACVEKPFTFDQLLDTVRAHVKTVAA